MKLRLTPFNIVTAFAIALLVVLLFQPIPQRPPQLFAIKAQELFLLALIVVSFITDLIFRFSLRTLKRIWIVELVVITIIAVVILILILQK
jgi:hypothetical protein